MNRKCRIPSYLDDFKCIAGSCKDNCCIGWDVDIDKFTFFKYQKIRDRELQNHIQKFLFKNRKSFSPDVDFARVKLVSKKRCAFLNEKNLCMLQAKYGEDYLSNVCATYPRLMNEIDGVIEYSATVSCEEAARLILLSKDGFTVKNIQEKAEHRSILVYQVDTKAKGQSLIVKYLKELRDLSIEVLKFRDIDIEDRMMILNQFYLELEKAYKERNEEKLKALISKYKAMVALKLIITKHVTKPDTDIRKSIDVRSTVIVTDASKQVLKMGNSQFEKQTKAKLELILVCLTELRVFKEIDSASYRKYTKEFLRGIGLNDSLKPNDKITEANIKKYDKAFANQYKDFISENGYILENYLVNYVYSNLFPAAESESPKDSFLMFALRFFIIKSQLIGISAANIKLDSKQAVSFIQSFSKAIEHHKTFIEDLAEMLKSEKSSLIKDLSVLIKN